MIKFREVAILLLLLPALANAGGVLRQSTAVDIIMGPFVDSTDGDTEETALTISQADVKLSKNGQTLAQKNDVTAAAHDANGMYNVELDATDTDTIGTLTVFVHETGALAVKQEYTIVDEAAYDAIYGSPATILTEIPAGILRDDTIGTVNSQTSFVLDTNIVSASNWVDNTAIVHDISTGEAVTRRITSVDQTTETVVIDSAPPFTVVVGDEFIVRGEQHPRAAVNNYSPSTSTAVTTLSDDMLDYFQLLMRSDAAINTDNTVALGVINTNEGSGAGDYDNQTDSIEAADASLATAQTDLDTITGTNGVLVSDDAITAAKIAADAIGASEIATDAIGSAEIASNAIGNQELQNDAIAAQHIAVNAIGSSELAPTAIDEIWDEALEDVGDSSTGRQIMRLLLAEAMGVCTYTQNTRTWVCKDPSDTETRFTLVYGTELDGDRQSSTLTPDGP